MDGDDIWRPPASPSPRRRSGGLGWALAAGGLCGVLLLACLLLTTSDLDLPDRRGTRPLPKSFAESERWQGKKVLIDTGVAADGRSYRFQVSRDRFGDLCHFLDVSTPGGPGGGGGGCGSADPLTFSMSSRGGVHGLTSRKVATVELMTAGGAVSVPTKPLPETFSPHRYFLVVLPPGTFPSRLVARDADGDVVKDQKLRPPPSPRR